MFRNASYWTQPGSCRGVEGSAFLQTFPEVRMPWLRFAPRDEPPGLQRLSYHNAVCGCLGLGAAKQAAHIAGLCIVLILHNARFCTPHPFGSPKVTLGHISEGQFPLGMVASSEFHPGSRTRNQRLRFVAHAKTGPLDQRADSVYSPQAIVQSSV